MYQVLQQSMDIWPSQCEQNGTHVRTHTSIWHVKSYAGTDMRREMQTHNIYLHVRSLPNSTRDHWIMETSAYQQAPVYCLNPDELNQL